MPLPRRMWAGGRLTFYGELDVGDEVARTSRIADVVVKEGRTGQLCFVTVEHTLSAGRKAILSERQNTVYRGPEARGTTQPHPAKPGRHRRVVEPSSPLLFRYSALTFNSHRIHYDRRYAMEVEGYPGLVVHGPLQATMLIHFAANCMESRHFALRSVPSRRSATRAVSRLMRPRMASG